jgi:drug/metabolite transporter (DMT)-like permease
MSYLILSILISTLFGISFKIIAVNNIKSFQAIVINYLVAGSLGFITTSSDVTPFTVFAQKWTWVAIGLGIVFVSSLFVIAETTARSGISVAQVSNRMAVVIPISVAVMYYGDALTVFKVAGIILAIVSVYLVSHKEESGREKQKLWWLFPLVIFICSGIIDSSINYAQRFLLSENDFDAFLSTVFMTAFVFGFLVLLYQLCIQKHAFQAKAIPAGAILGAINFGTMYFIVKALNSNVLEPSALFPVNNLSILTLSTIISVLVFKEKLSGKNWLGIALSLLAIFILGLLPRLF